LRMQLQVGHVDGCAGYWSGGCAMMESAMTAGYDHGWKVGSVAAL
jgi:hypothetical protein